MPCLRVCNVSVAWVALEPRSTGPDGFSLGKKNTLHLMFYESHHFEVGHSQILMPLYRRKLSGVGGWGLDSLPQETAPDYVLLTSLPYKAENLFILSVIYITFCKAFAYKRICFKQHFFVSSDYKMTLKRDNPSGCGRLGAF